MTEFSMEYNPYLVKTIFKKNGIEVSPNSRLTTQGRKERLQVLLGTKKGSNWKGLLEEIIGICNDDEIRLHFKGRAIDFEDLLYYLQKYDGDVKFSWEFEEGKNENDIMKELDKFFAEIKERNLPEFNEKNKNGKDVFQVYEDVKDGIFNISVIATMSSGKSTLINSILHTELLPSANKATTGTIGRIIDNDEMDHYEAICYAQDDKAVIYPKGAVDAEKMATYNADKRVQYIYVEGNIPNVSSDKIRLCLEDTPGPNNSRNENHERLTMEVIRRKNGIILYVMNATQFGINDDEQLLKDISEEMKKAGKQSHDKFIFVVNKCDELDEEKGETIEGMLAEVKKYLKQFDIVDPILIPTSARLALLIRKEQNGERLTRSEKRELNQIDDFIEEPLLHFEKYAAVTSSVSEVIKRKLEEYKGTEDSEEMEALIHTGVPVVEEVISEYIEKYAFPMKISDAVQDIRKILEEKNMEVRFKERLEANEEELVETQKQIAEAKKKHAEGQKLYKTYQKRIDEFSLDDVGYDISTKKRSIHREISKICEEHFEDRVLIDVLEADKMISKFMDKLNTHQKQCESKLNSDIDKYICQKGEEMIGEYSEILKNIFDNIKIEGYQFNMLREFKNLEIHNLDEIKTKYTQPRGHEETRWKPNPSRAGFFGFFKFWEPREISYKEYVVEGKDVNIQKVYMDVMTKYKMSVEENITGFFTDAKLQIECYKGVFKQNVDALNKKIFETLQKIEEDTRDAKELKRDLETNNELYKWIKRKNEVLHTMLEL